MIRPEELRIGNYFLTDERELAILTGMSPLGHLVRCDTEDGCELLHDIVKYDGSIDKGWEVESKYCEPIPITEGILLRCGFENPAYSFIGEIFHLTEWDDYPLNWCVAMNKNNAIVVHKLKYLHQLQNLFFALTGKELEMKQIP